MENNGGARGCVQQLTTAGPTANKQFVLLVLITPNGFGPSSSKTAAKIMVFPKVTLFGGHIFCTKRAVKA